MIFCIYCIFIKSLNFLSGRSSVVACGAQGTFMCNCPCATVHFQAETCSLTYNSGECKPNCNYHVCSQQGNGGNCTQTRKNGTCTLQFNSNGCEETIVRECNLTCRGGSFEQNCSELISQGTFQIHYSVAVHLGKCQHCCQSKESQRTKKCITTTESSTRISEDNHTSTGEWSNASAVVSTVLAKERKEKKRERRGNTLLLVSFLFPPLDLTF